MPRHTPATKGAGSGETPGRGAPAFDPREPEWENPPGLSLGPSLRRGQTRGTETSQYPEEKKSTEIPPVAASEAGVAQTAHMRGAGRSNRARASRNHSGKLGRSG